jgi:outer membrane protein OmpA-like peptidoglycan-associated protein
MSARKVLLVLIGSVVLVGCATVQESVEEEVDERVQENVDDGVERTADAVERGLENAVRCVVGNTECIEEAQEDGRTVVLTDEEGNVKRNDEGEPVTAASRSERDGQEGPETAGANFDFESGAHTLFATDLSEAKVGGFPRDLTFKNGTMEVVEWEGERALHVKSASTFEIELAESLPEAFTMTFGLYTDGYYTTLTAQPVDADGEPAGPNYLVAGPQRVGVGKTEDTEASTSLSSAGEGLGSELTPIRVMVDGSYVKVYVGRERVANIPNSDLGRTRTLQFKIYGMRGGATAYVGDVRVAGSQRDLYSALQREGRVAVQNLHFETGAATLKPAADSTLSAIATLLDEHPALTLLVEGHTDSTGSFESNMALSEKRAQAVTEALVQEYSIDADRLKSVGLGSTQPIAPNDTEEGRAKNRRVELVQR